jgi:hypothetical protein
MVSLIICLRILGADARMVLQLRDYDAPHQNLVCVLRCNNGNLLTGSEIAFMQDG